MTRLFFAACATASLLSIPAIAEELTDEITVTAHLVPTHIDRVGSSVSILDNVELERQQIQFLSEALNRLPGVGVIQTGSFGATQSTRLRGADTTDTVFLIDGIEVSDPTQIAPTFATEHLLSDGIDRVEVLRGSQSVLYGSDAIGGVVAVFTPTGSGPLSGALGGEIGSFDTKTASLFLQGGLFDDRLGFALNASHYRTSGISARDEQLGATETEAYDNLQLHGRIDYVLSDSITLDAAFRLANASGDFDGFGVDTAGLGNNTDQQSARLSATIDHTDRFISRVNFAGTRTYRDGFGPQTFNKNWFDGERLKADYLGIFYWSENTIFSFGAEHEEDDYEDNSGLKNDTRNRAGFAQLQTVLFDKIYVSAGGRHDDHSRFGDHSTWRVTAAYVMADHGLKLKGAAGTGFRAPSIYNLFAVPSFGAPIGNADLQPEESESYEAGFEKSLWDDRIALEAVWFKLDVEDDIDFGPFGVRGYFNQLGTTESEGIEVIIDAMPLDSLNIVGSYTYTHTHTPAGLRKVRTPTHAFNLNSNWSFDGGLGNLNGNIRHIRDYFDTGTPVVQMDNHLVVDLAATYQMTDDAQISLRADNVFNEQYRYAAGFGTPGRAYYVGLKITR